MSGLPTRIVWWAVACALLAFAVWPLAGAGPVGEDFRALAEAAHLVEGGVGPRALFAMESAGGRPLTALSLAASRWLWCPDGVWTELGVGFVRAENLLIAVVTALCLGRFLARLLLPWSGEEQARAAARAVALLFAVHPLTLPAVAAVAARGELLGAAFGTAAAWAFLRGRQEKRAGPIFAAAVLTAAAVACAESAWLIPASMGLAELVSAHRQRPGGQRLRTALTTLAAYTAGVAAVGVVLDGFGGEWRPLAIERSLAMFATPGGALRALGASFEKLGLSILPTNAAGLGAFGFVLAGALLLTALQPALRAARSAPRLWVAALIVWVVAILVVVVTRADVRVVPGELSAASSLLPATTVMAVGLAIAATALSGRRRRILPAVVGLGLCVLTHADARSLREAGAAADDLAGPLRDAALTPNVLVLDAPASVGGRAPLPADLAWVVDPSFGGPADPGAVRAIAAATLPVLAADPLFDGLRREGLALLLAAESAPVGAAVETVGGDWSLSPIAAPDEQGAVRLWREEGRSPDLELTGPSAGSLRATARPGARAEQVPVVRWDAGSEPVRSGTLAGVWLRGADGPVAAFDLDRHLPWLLAGTVRRVWFEGELSALVQARLAQDPPRIPGADEPLESGGTWTFQPDWTAVERGLEGTAAFALVLFEPHALRHRELVCRRNGELLVAKEPEGSFGPREGVVWFLEQRVGGVVVARSRGERGR
ncbi:MAG: hypothetical protein QF903_07645 [Planctomycetota bacterium]|jgi:hypothetical protein|nr:hypothetical protein [Planctomycetota bacterium]MDP6762024.1 hypothetical protein [Planctomycetota bacterium]MDP6989338.1 hypothetical protein [Planctomycetota bacterium]